MWKAALWAFVFSLGVLSAQNVRFKVVGYDDRPPERVDIFIYGWFGDTVAMATTTTGTAVLQMPAAGEYYVQVAGTFHLSTSFPVFFFPNAEYSIWIRLKPLQPRGKRPQILGDFNDFSFRKAVPLQPAGNGKFRFTLPVRNGMVRYQIVDTVGRGVRSFNGTQSDAYEFDGTDYISVLHVPDKDSVTIVVDYSQYPQGEFKEERHITLVSLPQVDSVYRICRRLYDRLRRAQVLNEPSPLSCEEIQKVLEQLPMAAHSETVRALQLGFAVLISGMDIVKNARCLGVTAQLQQQLPHLSPAHWFWSLNQGLLYHLASVMDSVPGLQLRIAEVALAHPRQDVRTMATIALIQNLSEHHDTAGVRDLIAALRTQYKNTRQRDFIEFLVDPYDPDNPVAVGKTVPHFELRDIADSAIVYTPAFFRGKYLLIDFWATWCGPCRAELPNLHRAYEQFKDKNFTILSISFDANPQIVQRFRQSPKTPMPWHHAFATGGFGSPVAKTFKVRGIPKPILVDPTGKIVAIEGALRGKRLLQTLKKHLGASQ